MQVSSPTAHTKARVATPVSTEVDVAIVGAGLGGLMTGLRLAQKGKSVAILDSHYVAGGCATMFSRGSGDLRCHFDIGLHYVGEVGEEERLGRLLSEVGVHLKWTPLDPDGFDELIFPDFRFRIPVGVEAYRDRMLALFPSEKKGIDRYIRLIEEVRFMGRPAAPRGWRQAWEALLHGRLVASGRRLTLSQFLDGCTNDVRLRAVMAGQSGDYGLPPSKVSALLHAGLVGHYLKGAWYPEGGGQVIADQLAEKLESTGGTIHLRHLVEEILVEGGRAVGLRWKGPHGESGVIKAPVVVSNADIKRTYLEMLPKESVTEDQRKQARNWSMGGAIFLTCLAVRSDLRSTGMRNANYWQFDSYDFEDFYRDCEKTEIPTVKGCYITSATLKDPQSPGHAPPGVDTVEVMALMPGASDAWGVAPSEAFSPAYRHSSAYLAHKSRVESELIRRLESLFPGSTKEILIRESATPVTHTRFTRASAGSGYGLAATPDQFLDQRPGPKGHLPGLFFTGASTRSGHGVLGALSSGAVTARSILRS